MLDFSKMTPNQIKGTRKDIITSEIINRLTFKCPVPGHGKHNGFEHPQCYAKYGNRMEEFEDRVAYLDLETEDLKADFGIIFCYSLLDDKTGKIIKDQITQSDIKKYTSKNRDIPSKEDTRVVHSLVKNILEYDRLILHYGSRFDLPFVRTRAIICGVDFPVYGTIFQRDTWQILRNKFKISRNSLENGCLKLLGTTRKDKLSLSIKHGCLRGEKWALDLAQKHCDQDVLDTRDLYKVIAPFARMTNSSI